MLNPSLRKRSDIWVFHSVQHSLNKSDPVSTKSLRGDTDSLAPNGKISGEGRMISASKQTLALKYNKHVPAYSEK